MGFDWSGITFSNILCWAVWLGPGKSQGNCLAGYKREGLTMQEHSPWLVPWLSTSLKGSYALTAWERGPFLLNFCFPFFLFLLLWLYRTCTLKVVKKTFYNFLPMGFTHWWRIGVAQCRSPSALSGSVWSGLAIGPLNSWGLISWHWSIHSRL